jgi:integrase
MAVLAECPVCHRKQGVKKRQCACGEDLVKAKKAERVRYWINWRYPGGKQRREFVGTSIEEAKDAEGKRRVQKRENRIFDIKPEAKMTFNELTEWYIDLERVKMLARYEILKFNLQSFNQVFGTVVVNRLKPVDLENYQAMRKGQGYADAYIDQHISTARAMVNKAFDNDIVSGDTIKVFRKVKKLCKPRSNERDRVLTPEEFNRLIQHSAPHAKPIFFTAYLSGMREGEILNLTRDKVDLRKPKPVIRLEAKDTKDREARTIPISDSLYAILSQIPTAIHDDHVFLYKGKPVRDIRTALRTACKKAGIPYGRNVKGGFVFHDLRHTFNTNMRKSGAVYTVTMDITGHSTMEMNRRYDTVDLEDKRKALAQMEAYLESVDQTVDQTVLPKKRGADQ